MAAVLCATAQTGLPAALCSVSKSPGRYQRRVYVTNIAICHGNVPGVSWRAQVQLGF